MRFFRRALVGLFLMALTVGLLTLAGGTIWSVGRAVTSSCLSGSRPQAKTP